MQLCIFSVWFPCSYQVSDSHPEQVHQAVHHIQDWLHPLCQSNSASIYTDSWETVERKKIWETLLCWKTIPDSLDDWLRAGLTSSDGKNLPLVSSSNPYDWPRCGRFTDRQSASHSVQSSSCVLSIWGRKSLSRVRPGEVISFIVHLQTFLLMQFLPTHFTILTLCAGKLWWKEPVLQQAGHWVMPHRRSIGVCTM